LDGGQGGGRYRKQAAAEAAAVTSSGGRLGRRPLQKQGGSAGGRHRKRAIAITGGRYEERAAVTGVLREVYDICESSYRIMGDNLGGGKQRTTYWHIEVLKRAKQ
jgi:hypothetical protein